MSRLPRILPLIAVAIGGVVVLRAAGAAPELFQGARAWAEEAVQPAGEGAAATPAKPAPAVCALSPEQLAQQAGLSPAELRVLQSLSKRREDLDARDADFATMLPLMASAEQKLDAKLQAMEALKAEMQGLLGQVDDREKAEIDRLVQVYSAMRPKDAAAVFTTLNDSVRLPVAAAMRPRSLAAVMAQMPPAAARELTEKLARRFESQQLAARAATASAPLTAAAPGSVATGAPAAVPAATPAVAPAPTPAATAPATQPSARTRPPAQRAANRPANRTTESRPTAAAPAPEPTGPQPYRAAPTAETPTAAPSPGRQQVQ